MKSVEPLHGKTSENTASATTATGWLLGLSLLAGLIGCGTVILNENFDKDAEGPLGSAWQVTANADSQSTVSVAAAPGHGNALRLHGSDRATDFIIAERGFSSDASEIVAEFAINPNAGAAFVWSFDGTSDYSPSARRIRLQRGPGSNVLVAETAPSGNTECGELASDTWSRISLAIHASGDKHSFDVRINGAQTACTGIETKIRAPFKGVGVMDATNDGWAGDTLFDDIQVTAL